MTVILYASYLTISIAMTAWVAESLKKNGRAFLIDAFRNNEEVADSLNHLLVVGFYLINIGYIALQLKVPEVPATTAECIELLSVKMGYVLLVLGAMHFLNLAVFTRLRKSGLLDRLLPPVEPNGRVEAKAAI